MLISYLPIVIVICYFSSNLILTKVAQSIYCFNLIGKSNVIEMKDYVQNERLFSGYSGKMFFILSFGWFTTQLGRRALPPLLPGIITDLSMTSAQAGIALSIMSGLYAIIHYPSGRLADELTRRTVIVTGISVMSLGFALLTISSNYIRFLVGVSFVGLGAGFYAVPLRALLADLFVERRGQAFGINTAFGATGNVLAALLAVVTIHVGAWQLSFFPVIFLLVPLFFLFNKYSQEKLIVRRIHLDLKVTIYRVLTSGRIRWLIATYSLFMFTWQGVLGFLPTFLEIEKGFSPVVASGSFALVFLVAAIVMPISGWMGDRIENLTVTLIALLIGSFGLIAMVTNSSKLGILIGIGIFAMGLMSFPPVMMSELMNKFPDESVGGDYGVSKSIYVGLGSIGPTYVGFLADYTNYTLAIGSILFGLLISIILVIGLILGGK